MIGLIVKGSTALFLEGPDPGREAAVAVVNRYKMGNMRSWEMKASELKLVVVPRPNPLSRSALSWAYIFLIASEGIESRLEPGPFDDELAGIVRAIETENLHDASTEG